MSKEFFLKRSVKIVGFSLFLGCLSFGISGDGLIEKAFPQYLGTFRFVKTVNDTETKLAHQIMQKFSLQITKKDVIFGFQDGKKKVKLRVTDQLIPFLDEQNHLVVERNGEFEPVIYIGDTLIVQSFPFEYQENYFVKNQ